MKEALTTGDRRALLQDLVQGGDGKTLPGVIYEDPDAAEHSRYYFVWKTGKEAVKYCCDTWEHADALLDLVSRRNELESTRKILQV